MGRPPKGGRTLGKADVLTEALRVLDREGRSGLTFKALGQALNITPMAVAHHVGNRQNMIRLLVERVYHRVDAPSAEAEPTRRIRDLMHRYCERVVRHPELTLSILEDPSLMGDTLQALTGRLRDEIAAAGVDTSAQETVLGLVVDYTHGFAFAAAADPERSLTVDDFTPGLDWILDRLR